MSLQQISDNVFDLYTTSFCKPVTVGYYHTFWAHVEYLNTVLSEQQLGSSKMFCGVCLMFFHHIAKTYSFPPFHREEISSSRDAIIAVVLKCANAQLAPCHCGLRASWTVFFNVGYAVLCDKVHKASQVT